MSWKIEVFNLPEIPDPLAAGLMDGIKDLGVGGVEDVEVSKVYLMEGDISHSEVEAISKELLTDPITQRYSLEDRPFKGDYVLEVAYNPGVMDPVEESVRKGIRDLSITGVESVKTAMRYIITGEITEEQLQLIIDKLLVNSVIQHVVTGEEAPSLPSAAYGFKLVTVDLLSANDARLMAISRKGQLFLNLHEMKEIKSHFSDLGRNPTDLELETLAQTWSEHCVHKTFKGTIEYDGDVINNLLKSTIMKVTQEIDRPWCISVFEDNAGVIEFDRDYAICFKVETHNHPSALEPYGGAGTGIGGVIRDPLGTGLGAKPIANTDIFCFGPLDCPHDKLPKGVLHPKRTMKGVVGGVRDYGNRMGIPTLNGSIFFDERYLGNPLVYCGNVGIMPKDKCFKKVQPGDLIVLVGGRTGRDGIHGATFSSGELTEESESISSGAVQIGNPITEKKMTDVLLRARDLGLYNAITDCGGGGLSSAVGETGKDIGVEVDLEKVPLKYKGLTYTEIWISEAQERMILAVPPEKADRLIEVFAEEDVEATVIGEFVPSGKLLLRYQGNAVCDLDMRFLHDGLPLPRKKAIWKEPDFPEPDFPEPSDLTRHLRDILASPNVCSKEWVIRQYDHEVQGASVLKPLVGMKNDGPGDASVIRPVFESPKGVIISNGVNPKYGPIDPYWMAASAIDEALRQVIAVGGRRNRTALLDNFCWGNPDKPENLGGLVRAAKACYDMAKVYETPFVSGKDSLNNEYAVEDETISIPPTLLISAMSVIDDIDKVISMDFKKAESLIYVVGLTKDEMGGSHYYFVNGYTGKRVPEVDPELGKKVMDQLSEAVNMGLVISCHDCSEGGIGVAVSEMAFSGEMGARIYMAEIPRGEGVSRNDTLLFSESNTRFIVEVPESSKDDFEEAMAGVPYGQIGKTCSTNTLTVYGLDGTEIVKSDIFELKEAWQATLRSV